MVVRHKGHTADFSVPKLSPWATLSRGQDLTFEGQPRREALVNTRALQIHFSLSRYLKTF